MDVLTAGPYNRKPFPRPLSRLTVRLRSTMALNDETLRFPIEEIIVAQDIDYRSFIPNCIFPERVDPPPAPFE